MYYVSVFVDGQTVGRVPVTDEFIADILKSETVTSTITLDPVSPTQQVVVEINRDPDPA